VGGVSRPTLGPFENRSDGGFVFVLLPAVGRDGRGGRGATGRR